jgi:hypothetical protein
MSELILPPAAADFAPLAPVAAGSQAGETGRVDDFKPTRRVRVGYVFV